jgi:adenosylmethionine-8-amino-7-oxononanoate aminotransferase
MTLPATTLSADELQQAARDHLWLHFTRMSAYMDGEIPIIVRGDGCYLEDANGKRYLDALAGLFAVNIGYGFGEAMGEAAAAQMRELPFYTNWSYAHPRAIELAAEVASLAPGDLNRVFFCSGGSEAVESAWKLARQYHAARGERRWKAVARRIAYHGTTMGALSINGIAALRTPFEPLVPDTVHVWNTNRYHRPKEETEAEFTAFLLEDLEEAILQAGPETVAMVIMEPVQNAGGSFTAPEGYWQGVREICDRYGILLVADEVITGFGRLGAWFGSERYDIRPDIVTSAKGLSSAYASIGAVIARDAVMEPFLEGKSMYAHGITFGGHPVQAAIALKNIEIMKREGIVEHVAETQDDLKEGLETLLELPIVGDVRGTGFFYALELVKDKETRETFDAEESEWLLRSFLSGRLFERGLICRADDRGDPVVQVSPPLVAGQAEFDQIVGILGDVLAEAWSEYDRRRGPASGPAAASAPEAPVAPPAGVVPGTRIERQP